MPELPDVVVYIEAIGERVLDRALHKVRLASPFLLRTVDPPIREAEGRRVVRLRRLGKRIVFELEGSLFLVIHLMIAGRLRWETPGAKIPGRLGLAAFDFRAGAAVHAESWCGKHDALHPRP